MSNKAMAWAVAVEGLHITRRGILMLLAECHNGERGQCNPSMEWLLDKTGLKERALQMHMKGLEEAGLVSREYTHFGRGKGCTVSQYNLKIGITGAVNKPQEDAPAKSCGRKKASMRPQNLAAPYKEEPEKNRKDMSQTVFDDIWKAWSPDGRRRSKSKKLCQDALSRQIKKSDPQTIRKAALMFAKTTDGRYHPALDRWLRDGKWENWIGRSTVGTPEQQKPTPEDWQHWIDHYRNFGEWIPDDIPIPENLKGAA